MRLLKPSSILFLLGMLGISRGRAQDLQTWNEIDVVGNWRKIDLTLPLVARLDFRQSNPQFFAAGGLADIHLFADTVLTGGYLFVDLPTHNSEVHAASHICFGEDSVRPVDSVRSKSVRALVRSWPTRSPQWTGLFARALPQPLSH